MSSKRGRDRELRAGEVAEAPPPSLSLSCGSSKQPWLGQLRGWCMTSQAENGPCPFLPCSISFSSCLSFVMDTACNKKSQHIYGVADPASTRLLYRPATKQLCYPLRIPESSSGGRRLRAASLTLACEQKERIAFFSSVFFLFSA